MLLYPASMEVVWLCPDGLLVAPPRGLLAWWWCSGGLLVVLPWSLAGGGGGRLLALSLLGIYAGIIDYDFAEVILQNG